MTKSKHEIEGEEFTLQELYVLQDGFRSGFYEQYQRLFAASQAVEVSSTLAAHEPQTLETYLTSQGHYGCIENLKEIPVAVEDGIKVLQAIEVEE